MTPGTLAYSDITIEPQLIYGVLFLHPQPAQTNFYTLEPELVYAEASMNVYNGQIYSSWYRSPGLCATVQERVNATFACPLKGQVVSNH